MRTVRQLLDAKPAEIVSIGPDAPVIEALRRMAEREIGALLVMEGPELVGIVSERDYARKVVLLGRASVDTPVREVMTRAVRFVHPSHSAEQCMALMTENRLRHLPVVDEGRVAGLVSIGDLVKSVISEQQFIITEMERYITGAR